MFSDSDLSWLTNATPIQFALGVLLLVFGSKKVFSEKNVAESLGGLRLPFRLLRRKREEAARREAEEQESISNEIVKYHRWSVQVTQWHRRLELWAAEKGLTLPEPPFVHWTDFEIYPKEKEKREEEDEE